jgi:hypothetical protein
MTAPDPAIWSDLLERTLRRYEEPLVREVAGRLLRPRNQWPLEDLISRSVATLGDVTTIERRLKDLEPPERHLLALIGHSRQPRWNLGNLAELVMSLGHSDGLAPVLNLLNAGLLYPVLSLNGERQTRRPGLKSFAQWLAHSGSVQAQVFAHPLAMTRAISEEIPLDCPESVAVSGPPLEADGLDWLLRLAVLWQQVAAAPIRRTQQGDFFKRDHDRLDNDPLLNCPSTEGLPTVPDAAFLAVDLALGTGLLFETEGDLRAAPTPHAWSEGLPAVLASLWQALPRVRAWDPLEGRRDLTIPGNPFPSAALLALLMLGRLPQDSWTTPNSVLDSVLTCHPFWREQNLRPSRLRDWMSPLLLGLAYQLRLVQAARTEEGASWAVRLSSLGRWVLCLGPLPHAEPIFPRTILVQPNLEIVAYRQGLTPALIDFLARIANWQSLGSVCMLQLGPESVYRALEGGQTFEGILQTLEQHGTRPTPPGVVESLRTWSNKRDRITVYPSAALVEFGSGEDLDAALARGFPGVRIEERLAVVASESSIDYSLFRLTSSRDYASRPEQCVEVGDDGVTLTVDLSRSDLLLESELSRFAEAVDRPSSNGRRRYRLTPESVAIARDAGMSPQSLETWFQQRAGRSASPAALLLLNANQGVPSSLRPMLVLHVGSAEMADGLLQWPATRELIQERLGPTSVSVAAENVEALKKQLETLGMTVKEES